MSGKHAFDGGILAAVAHISSVAIAYIPASITLIWLHKMTRHFFDM